MYWLKEQRQLCNRYIARSTEEFGANEITGKPEFGKKRKGREVFWNTPTVFLLLTCYKQACNKIQNWTDKYNNNCC